MPTEAGMIYTIDGKTLHMFTKNMWIGDSGTSYHRTNDDTGRFNVSKINDLVQGSLGGMPPKRESFMSMFAKLLKGYTFYGP